METKGFMRPLSEEELHNIYGGSILQKSLIGLSVTFSMRKWTSIVGNLSASQVIMAQICTEWRLISNQCEQGL